MKKRILLIVSSVLIVMLSACNSNNEKATESQPKMLNVALSVNPSPAKVNEPILFEAKVTYGSEKVNDAEEVTFEIWRSKDTKHEKINISHPKNGIYSLKKTFQQEGTYYIISHVTARGMHNMPQKEFVVGKPSQAEDSKSHDSMGGMNMNENSSK